MGNTCTSCNCNNNGDPSEMLTVDNNKVAAIFLLQLLGRGSKRAQFLARGCGK